MPNYTDIRRRHGVITQETTFESLPLEIQNLEVKNVISSHENIGNTFHLLLRIIKFLKSYAAVQLLAVM